MNIAGEQNNLSLDFRFHYAVARNSNVAHAQREESVKNS